MDIKYKFARLIFSAIGISSVLLYVLASPLATVNLQQDVNDQKSFFMVTYYILTAIVFIPDLPLVLLTFYLMINIKILRVNLIGLFIVLGLFLMHLWVEMAAAHANPVHGFIVQLSDFLIVVFIFWVMRRKVKIIESESNNMNE